MCSRTPSRGSFDVVGPNRVRPAWSNLIQTWSNLVNPGQTWSNASDPILRLFWCGEPSTDQVGSVRAASFYMPTPEKISGVKIGLWQLPFLCLAFLGTRNAGQRINDSIFAHWDFLDFRAHPQVLQQFFLSLHVTLCQMCWFSIVWHTGQKSKVSFRFLVLSQNSIFPTSAFSVSSLLAQISRSGSPFAFLSVPFFVCFFLVFSLLSHAIVHFEIICTLSKHVSVQNAFMYKNMYTPKWEFVGTYEYTYMFRRIKGEERKFLGTMLCIFWFTFFFMHVVVCVLLVGQKYWKV